MVVKVGVPNGVRIGSDNVPPPYMAELLNTDMLEGAVQSAAVEVTT